MMSVRSTWGVTVSGVNGLWEHGTFDLLARRQPAGRPRRGGDRLRPAGVRHGRRADSVRGCRAHRRGGAQPQLGGRLELGPAFDLTLELERSDSADPDTAAEHDITLEGSFSW